MWIREDLKDAIKQIFSIGDFEYERTENMYDEDLLILSDGNRKIAIEISVFDDDFFIYEVKNNEETYCRENFKLVTLCYEEGKTKLKFNGIIEFEGKAFDFDLELVTLRLERGAQDVDDYFYLKKLQGTTKKGYQKKTHLRKNFKKMSLIKKIKF